MRKKNPKREIACLLLLTFSCTNLVAPVPAWSQISLPPFSSEFRIPPSQTPFDIPHELGKVQDFSFSSPQSKEPFVIHIQDAHSEPEAQINIQKIIDYVSSPGLNDSLPILVALEGTVDEIHPEYFNLFPANPKLNEAAIQDLLQKGELSGAELAAWERYKKEAGRWKVEGGRSLLGPGSRISGNLAPIGVRFVGVEDPDLYRKNLATFRELLFQREEIEAELQKIQTKLDGESSKIHNPHLRKFLVERMRRKEGQYGSSETSPQLMAYLRYLKAQLLEHASIDLDDKIEQLRFPNLVRVLVLEESQKDLDLDKANLEKQSFLNRLEMSLRAIASPNVIPAPVSQAAVGRLNIRHRAVGPAKAGIHGSPIKTFGDDTMLQNQQLIDFFKLDNHSTQDYRQRAENLWMLASRHGINPSHFDEFWKSIGSEILFSEIETDSLFAEIEQLEKTLIEKWLPTQREREFFQTLEDFALAKKLLKLELTASEFEILSVILSTEGAKDLRFFASLRMTEDLKNWFKQALDFYSGAKRRDKVLFENALKKARDLNASKVILITGGFHTPGLKEELKSKNINYAVVQPHFFPTDHGECYRKVLRKDNADVSVYTSKPLNRQQALFLKTIMETQLSRVEKAKAIQEHPVLNPVSEFSRATNAVASTLLATEARRFDSLDNSKLLRAEMRNKEFSLIHVYSSNRSEARQQLEQHHDFENSVLMSLVNYLDLGQLDDDLLETSVVDELSPKHSLAKRRLTDLFNQHYRRNGDDKPLLTIRGQQSVARSFDIYLRSQKKVDLSAATLFEIPNTEYAIEIRANKRGETPVDIFGNAPKQITEQIKFFTVLNRLTANGKRADFIRYLGGLDVKYYEALRMVREIYREKNDNKINDQLILSPTVTFDVFIERINEALQKVSQGFEKDPKVFIDRLRAAVNDFIDLNDLAVEMLVDAIDRKYISREDGKILLFLQQIGIGIVSEEVVRAIKEGTHNISLGDYQFSFQYNPGRANRGGMFPTRMVGGYKETILSLPYISEFYPLQRWIPYTAPDGTLYREVANPYPHKKSSMNAVYDPIAPQIPSVEDIESRLINLRTNVHEGETTRFRDFFNSHFAGFTIPHLHYQEFLGETNAEVALKKEGALEQIALDENGVAYHIVNNNFFDKKSDFPLRTMFVIEGEKALDVAKAAMRILRQANKDGSVELTPNSLFTYNLFLVDEGDKFRVYIPTMNLVKDPFDSSSVMEPNLVVLTNEEHLSVEVKSLEDQIKALISQAAELNAELEKASDDEMRKEIKAQLSGLKKQHGKLIEKGFENGTVIFSGRPAAVEMMDTLIFGHPSQKKAFDKIMSYPSLQRHLIHEIFTQMRNPVFENVVQTTRGFDVRAEARNLDFNDETTPFSFTGLIVRYANSFGQSATGLTWPVGARNRLRVNVPAVADHRDQDAVSFPIEDHAIISDSKAVGRDSASDKTVGKIQWVGDLRLTSFPETRPLSRDASREARNSGFNVSRSSLIPSSPSSVFRSSKSPRVLPLESTKRTIPFNANGSFAARAGLSNTIFSSDKPFNNETITAPPDETKYSTDNRNPRAPILSSHSRRSEARLQNSDSHKSNGKLNGKKISHEKQRLLEKSVETARPEARATKAEIEKGRKYWAKESATTPTPKDYRPSKTEEIRDIARDFSSDELRDFETVGALSVNSGEGYFASLIAGASSRMNPSEVPEDVQELLAGKEINSKAAVPIGAWEGKPVTYLGEDHTNLARFFQQIEEEAGKAGIVSKVWENTAGHMSNNAYRPEHDAMLRENNNYGLKPEQIRFFHQPLGPVYYARAEAVESLQNDKKFSGEEPYRAAAELSTKAEDHFNAGNYESLIIPGELQAQGHGEFWHQLVISGELLYMIYSGKKWGFVRNIDNVPAKYDKVFLRLLGFFLKNKLDLLMEGAPNFSGHKGGKFYVTPNGDHRIDEDPNAKAAGLNPQDASHVNNAVAFFTTHYIISLYKKDGQTDEDFIAELRQASPLERGEIAERGRSKFPIIWDAKPSTVSPAVYAKGETNMWQSTMVQGPDVKILGIGVDGSRNFSIERFLNNMSASEQEEALASLRFIATKNWNKPDAEIQKAKQQLEASEGRPVTENELNITLETYVGNRILYPALIKYSRTADLVTPGIFSRAEAREPSKDENADGLTKIEIEGHEILSSEKIYPPNSMSTALFIKGIRLEEGDKVWDWGTGSGILGIVAADRGAGWVLETDENVSAVELARLNVSRSGYDNKIRVESADGINLPADLTGTKFDRIYANPSIPGQHGPADARYSDPKMEFLDLILNESPRFLTEGGTLEINYLETPSFLKRVYEKGWEPVVIEGTDYTRSHQRGVFDYARFTLVRQKDAVNRQNELEQIKRTWTTLSGWEEKALSQTRFDEGDAQNFYKVQAQYADSQDFNSQLIVKTMMTLAYPRRFSVPDIRLNQLYPEYHPKRRAEARKAVEIEVGMDLGEDSFDLQRKLVENSVIVIDSELPEGIQYEDYRRQYFDLAVKLGKALYALQLDGNKDRKVIIVRDHLGVGATDDFYLAMRVAFPQEESPNFDVVYQPNIVQKKDGLARPELIYGLRDTLGEKKTANREITKKILRQHNGETAKMKFVNIRSAELSFEAYILILATKLTHLRDLAAPAEAIGGNVYEVAFGAGLDRRIQFQHINPSLAFGGKLALLIDWIYEERITRLSRHIPNIKEVIERAAREAESGEKSFENAIQTLSSNSDLASEVHTALLLELIQRINQKHLNDAFHKIVNSLPQVPMQFNTVSFLGVGYKEDEEQITNSPVLILIEKLFAAGVRNFIISDTPERLNSFKNWLEQKREKDPNYRSAIFQGVEGNGPYNIYETVKGSHIAIVAQESHPELKKLDLARLGKALNGIPFFDGIGLFGRRANGELQYTFKEVRENKINLVSFGRGPLEFLTDSRVYRTPEDLKHLGIVKTSKKVLVIGAGYVGLVTAAYFAERGHDVTVYDIDKRKIRMLDREADEMESPIHEPGLLELLKKVKRAGRFRATDNLERALSDTEYIYVAVPTPQSDTGAVNLSYIRKVAEDLAGYFKKKSPKRIIPIVIKSTVTNRAFEIARGVFKTHGITGPLSPVWVSSPEFLKEGTALADVEKPDRTQIGLPENLPEEISQQVERLMLELLASHMEHYPHPIFVTVVPNSTLTKYAANSFLAISITLAKNLADNAAKYHADFEEVKSILYDLDAIGPYAFIRAGCWGGSCFPKDVRALHTYSSELPSVSHPLRLIQAIDALNDYYKIAIVNDAERLFKYHGQTLIGSTIALFGMTFKSDTDDMRETPSAVVAYHLRKRGVTQIRIHDPILNKIGTEDRRKEELKSNYLHELFRLLNRDDTFIQAAEKFREQELGNHPRFLVDLYKRVNRVSKASQAQTREFRSKLEKGEISPSTLTVFREMYFRENYFKNPKSEFNETNILFFEEVDEVVESVEAIVLVTDWPEYKSVDFTTIKEILSHRLFGIVDSRNQWHVQAKEGKFIHLGISRIGVGSPPQWAKLMRAEVRYVIPPTVQFYRELTQASRKRFTVLPENPEAIRGIAGVSAKGIYSVVRISESLEEQGIPADQAKFSAISFILNDWKLDRPQMPALSQDQKEALGEFELRFFTPTDLKRTKNQWVIKQHFSNIPQIADDLVLNLRKLANNNNLIWHIDIDNASREEKQEWLVDLLNLAESNDIKLESGQIIISSGEKPGFDRDLLAPRRQSIAFGYLSDDINSLKEVPISQNVQFLRTASTEIDARVAEWLLAAEALEREYRDIEIGLAKNLSQDSSEYTRLLNAVQAFREVLTSA